VTLIAGDGRVVGDSTQTLPELRALENHATRPEVQEAQEDGLGVSERYSTTTRTTMLYVAARTSHPQVRYVRLSLPLGQIAEELAAIGTLTLVALAAAIPSALIVAWIFAAPLARRVQNIAEVATRYAGGDLSRSVIDDGADELGSVARVLDASVQELGRRLRELSRDRARTDAMLAGMVEGVLVVDGGGRVQLINRAAREMLHLDSSDVGRRYLEVVRHPDIVAELDTALRGEEPGARELTFARDPGRIFVARAAPVAAEGGGGAVVVLHDITDLRRADQIRRDFVANVSHELRTPLTAIRGYVEALLDQPADAADAKRFLDIIDRHTSRMDRLVTDLLRLARLDARQERPERTACDVRRVMEDVIEDLSGPIAGHEHRVQVDVAPDAGVVHADAGHLHDVLRNLLENAVHYAGQRAEIQLSARREEGKIAIAVADSGPGLPPADLRRVFERFYRVDKSRSHPGGTGLGLAIVKHLVELHGGTVEAGNRRGGGAVFTISLPA
jgi:two-component system phosphate regulon sensor histidine kinase PhoR